MIGHPDRTAKWRVDPLTADRRANWKVAFESDQSREAEFNRREFLVHEWFRWRQRTEGFGGVSVPALFDAFRRMAEVAGLGPVTLRTLRRWTFNYIEDGERGLFDLSWFRSKPAAGWPFIRALTGLYRGDSVKHPNVPLPWAIDFCHHHALKLAEDYDWPRCTRRESERWIKGHLLANTTHGSGADDSEVGAADAGPSESQPGAGIAARSEEGGSNAG